MLQNLKAEIIRKFQTQSDFAIAVGAHESKISQVVRQRRRLSEKEAKKWQDALGCSLRFLAPAIKK